MTSSPILFVATIFAAFLLAMTKASPTRGNHGHKGSYINYSTVTGFFLQDENSTDASTFDYTKVNLGLINRTYETDKECGPQKTQWQRFEYYVHQLNRKAPKDVQYKVLVMGRHGEGFHNVAESFYGTPAWDCYWSLLDGNETTVWADAKITEKGLEQANIAHAFWKNALTTAKIPAPESYYSSPLARCLETARITYSDLPLPRDRPFKPVVKELLREALGVHTCDRRSTKTWIRENYPRFKFEDGFAEEDPLWDAGLREVRSAQVARLRTLLDDIFTNDDNTFIAFSSHSGSLGSILEAIGHRTFSLVTGAVIPVLVKAETIRGPTPTRVIGTPTPPPTCTANPTQTP